MESVRRIRFAVFTAAILSVYGASPASAAEALAADAPPGSGSSGCGKALAAGMNAGTTTSRTIDSAAGGGRRTYLVHVPAGYDASKPAPVVLNFHGFGSNPEKQNDLSAFVPISDREGFVLVTPNGGIGWRFAESARRENTAFVRDLVASAESELCVDTKRIFATGKSQGGFMSSWLACDVPVLVAAVAPVSGMYEPSDSCGPVPFLEFHGRADTTIPFGGGRVLILGNFRGAVGVMQRWAAANRCQGVPETVDVSPHVQRVTYAGCAATTIQYLTDAGHTWPGTTVREGDDSKPADLAASELIWAFFKAHPRP